MAVSVGVRHHTAEARGYRLFEETKRRIRGHAGPAFVVIDDSSQQLRGLAQELGNTWPDAPCAAITTDVYAAFRLCQGTIAAVMDRSNFSFLVTTCLVRC